MSVKIRRSLLGFCIAFVALGVAAALAPVPTATAQPSSHGSDTVQTRFILDPLAFYKPSGGIGVGGRMETANLFRPGTTLTLEGYVAQYRGDYAITFSPRDLMHEGWTSAISVRYETQGRLPYYGLGPRTRENERVFVDADQLTAMGVVGVRHQALGGLASAGFLTGQVSSYRDDTDDAFDRLDERSAARLETSAGTRVQGLTIGGTLYADGRDDRHRPTRGVLLAAGADVFLGAPDGMVQPHVSAMVFAPLGSSIVTARGLAVLSRPFGEGTVPLLLLPRIGNRFTLVTSGRLAGRDLVLIDVKVQRPLGLPLDARIVGEMATDVYLLVGAYNAYDNLFDEVRWTPSWTDRFAGSGRTPLRAMVGAGLHAYEPATKKPLYTVGLGLSADGITVSALTFTLDPRQLRPLWRW